ncbi:MAG: hypothetical protein HY905_21895 [Deltaproteobacteria bacterium]|nr:hypothetical protein [Deltaproteobacteria bacterium]
MARCLEQPRSVWLGGVGAAGRRALRGGAASRLRKATPDVPSYTCGNGTVEAPSEECDDGDSDQTNGCTTECPPHVRNGAGGILHRRRRPGMDVLPDAGARRRQAPSFARLRGCRPGSPRQRVVLQRSSSIGERAPPK